MCANCKTAYNKETFIESTDEQDQTPNQADKSEAKECPECNGTMEHRNSIEIAHTFYLGTQYSEKMSALYTDNQPDQIELQPGEASLTNKKPLEMCCFGIGVTRMLSAFMTQQTDSLDINWPLRIAPYHVLIIPPKKGSKQNVGEIGSRMADHISIALKSKGLDVLIDNRLELTIGRRLIDSLAYGFPYRIVVGKESIGEIPRFELHSKNEKISLTHAELLNKFDEISKLLKDD